MRSFVLSLGVRECYSVLNIFLLWLTSRLGRARACPPLELSRRPGYVLVLTLVSFGDFELGLDVCSFDIPDRLSSEYFGAHR